MYFDKPLIIKVALPLALRREFDYQLPLHHAVPLIGTRVKVPFRNKILVGIVLEICTTTTIKTDKLKPLSDILDTASIFSEDVYYLCLWAAKYYHHAVGAVFETAMPVLLRQGHSALSTPEQFWRVAEPLDRLQVSKAPKQTEFLQWLQHFPEGVSKQQMKDFGVASATVKTLFKKNLICCQDAPVAKKEFSKIVIEENCHVLNSDQARAVDLINAVQSFSVILLDGVTGSGKTEVYLQVIAKVLAQQKQVLVLIPEIGLTPQTIQRFQKRFCVPIVCLHSGLSNKDRLSAWQAAKSGAAKIVIGTRSAVFTSYENLGLIIIDEEHDLSFKQQEGFRYNARDLAIMRAQKNAIPIVLGSATPSLESLNHALQKRYQHVVLPTRAGVALQPVFHVIDIRKKYCDEGLSEPLLQAMREHLQLGNQVMLFLNRRGFAPVFMCHACGWMAVCKRCDMRMTYHHEFKRLHCHHCDTKKPIMKHCENCREPDLHIIGLGTERLEQCMQKHFPDHSVVRIDRDSTQRKGAMADHLQNIENGSHQILIGTQMLAKGHHFPNVTLVGIVDMDGGFFSADFRAIERTAQTMLQVSGRAGRVEKPGTVLIQTRHPEHPALQLLLKEGYGCFAQGILLERQAAILPPFGFIALFRAEAHAIIHATQFLQGIVTLSSVFHKKISLLGPVPAPMAKRAGRYRMQLLIQSTERQLIQQLLTTIMPSIEAHPLQQKVRWSLDVDPVELI